MALTGEMLAAARRIFGAPFEDTPGRSEWQYACEHCGAIRMSWRAREVHYATAHPLWRAEQLALMMESIDRAHAQQRRALEEAAESQRRAIVESFEELDETTRLAVPLYRDSKVTRGGRRAIDLDE
jgi:hypothetical protein